MKSLLQYDSAVKHERFHGCPQLGPPLCREVQVSVFFCVRTSTCFSIFTNFSEWIQDALNQGLVYISGSSFQELKLGLLCISFSSYSGCIKVRNVLQQWFKFRFGLIYICSINKKLISNN